MPIQKTKILVEFVCDMPDDDLESDDAADEIAAAVERVVSTVPRIFDGSVKVTDWTTLPEGENGG